jgi:hypothetical protein
MSSSCVCLLVVYVSVYFGQVTGLFKETGISNISVQVEKRVYFQHLLGLGLTMDRMHAMTNGFKTLTHETHPADFIGDL